MKKLLGLFFLIFPLATSAQEGKLFEYPRFRLGFETGIGFLNGTTVIPDAVRQNQSYYYDDYYYSDYYYCGFMGDYNTVPQYYIGVKPEFSMNNRFALAAGLRFLSSTPNLTSDKDYFLWKISENDLTTHYARVKNVKQNRLYIGVPVEMTFYTYRKDFFVRHFFRGGASFNFLFMSKTTPYFANTAMNKYTDKVINDVEKNDLFSSPVFTPAFFIGTGLKIGRMNHPFGTIEFRIPFTVNSGFSSFIKTSVGVELQFAIYIPLGKEKLTWIDD